MSGLETAWGFMEKTYAVGHWLLRRIFNKERTEHRILVQAMPHSRALFIDCLGNTVDAYVRVFNLNPFAVKVQRCVLRLNHGFSLQMTPDDLPTIPAFSSRDIYARQNLSPEHGKQAAQRAAQSSDPTLSFNLTLELPFGTAEKSGALDHIPCEKINVQAHQQSSAANQSVAKTG